MINRWISVANQHDRAWCDSGMGRPPCVMRSGDLGCHLSREMQGLRATGSGPSSGTPKLCRPPTRPARLRG